MAILSRFIQLCKADLHGVMDEMEDKSLLLKQHLREMEAAISGNESQLRGLKASINECQSIHDNHFNEMEKLQADLTMAVTKERDDIARMLIRKIKPVQVLLENLERQMKELETERDRLKETIKKQRGAYEKIRVQSIAYLKRMDHEHREEESGGAVTAFFSEDEPSAEEVELELMRQKDKILGGVKK